MAWYSVAVSLPCALRFGLHFSYERFDRNIVVDNNLTKVYIYTLKSYWDWNIEIRNSSPYKSMMYFYRTNYTYLRSYLLPNARPTSKHACNARTGGVTPENNTPSKHGGAPKSMQTIVRSHAYNWRCNVHQWRIHHQTGVADRSQPSVPLIETFHLCI